MRIENVYDALIQALAEIDRPGDFCTFGDRELTMPGLVVEGPGLLSLPLGKTQALELIACCRQAPYGKGADTIVDTKVRRVWELDAKHLQFTNPKWEGLIESIVGQVKRKLGLKKHTLTAQLYKLLVYEKGSFFLPHRDGEKLDRMVATLVVALPSVHQGGALIVSHNGRQKDITYAGAASGHELSYAAFYADCQHEVRPLEAGYRLCLTYNVTLAKSRGRKGISAPAYGPVVDEIQAHLAAWRKDHPDSKKLAVTLDHRYTRDGLTLDTLKGIDRSRAEVLFEAAERADCVAHLALITLWQHGTAECDWDGYSHGWDGGHHRAGDDDEYEMGEIFDASLSADHWSDRQGKKVLFGEIPLEDDEIVAETGIDAGDPSEEDFEDYTGNAGMTLERWYHRAALVFWPREKHFAVLCGAGTDAAIGGLEPMVERLGQASKAHRDVQRQECLAFAAAIIDTWQPPRGVRSWNNSENIDRDVFPRLLCVLDDPESVRRFLAQVMAVDGGIQLDTAFVKCCKRHGWKCFEAELLSVIDATTAQTLVRNAGMVQLFCRQHDDNAERLALCARLCENTVRALEAIDSQPSKGDWRIGKIDRTALLVSLVDAMLMINVRSPLVFLIDHALSRRDRYRLTKTHLAAIFALEARLDELAESNAAISHWLAVCRQELEARTARAPQKPADYRRAHELSCSCGDCSQLSRFLADPGQRENRMPLNKARRRHLHEVIDGKRCDLKHVTERRGRPFTLVCTKTTASYRRALKIHERDTNNLSRIVDLGKRII